MCELVLTVEQPWMDDHKTNKTQTIVNLAPHH